MERRINPVELELETLCESSALRFIELEEEKNQQRLSLPRNERYHQLRKERRKHTVEGKEGPVSASQCQSVPVPEAALAEKRVKYKNVWILVHSGLLSMYNSQCPALQMKN